MLALGQGDAGDGSDLDGRRLRRRWGGTGGGVELVLGQLTDDAHGRPRFDQRCLVAVEDRRFAGRRRQGGDGGRWGLRALKGRGGGDGATAFQLAEAEIDVRDQAVEAFVELAHLEAKAFDLTGHGAHFLLKPVDADLELRRRGGRQAGFGGGGGHRRRRVTAIDRALQGLQLALEAGEVVGQGAEILGRRGDGQHCRAREQRRGQGGTTAGITKFRQDDSPPF